MQVKKFEAKSMKEALTMVKQELGPEAIILSAKDNKKTYGLAGKGSIEVTAAISEKSLQKRQFTESKFPESSREKFRATSAKNQRNVIENTVTKYQERRVSKASQQAAEAFKTLSDNPHKLGFVGGAKSSQSALVPAVNMTRPNFVTSGRRYIDILDDEHQNQASSYNGRRVDDILEEFAKTGSFILEDSSRRATELTIDSNPEFTVGSSRDDVQAMRKEVEQLRGLLSQYQNGNHSNRGPVTQHPGAEFNLPFELAASFEKLQMAGIDSRYIVEILEKANTELSGLEKKKRNLIDAWVARYLLSHVSITDPYGSESNQDGAKFQLFVGPAGHGKTSALVNVASQMVMKDKKQIVLVTADTFKIGAVEQLRTYAQILGVPFEVVNQSSDFNLIIKKYPHADAVLVDFPGFSLKNTEECDALRKLMPPRDIERSTHLVLSGALRDLDAYESTSRYQMTMFNDLIITRLDECLSHGLLFNIQRKTEKPLYAFGLGSKISEDFEVASRERVLDLIYKISTS
jgi:flagellar biosynthesis protein FlhF